MSLYNKIWVRDVMVNIYVIVDGLMMVYEGIYLVK